MPTQRIPLVGSYTNRQLAAGIQEDQVFTNCFPVVTTNPQTNRTSVQLVKRFGYLKDVALTGVDSALTAGAICVWTGNTANAAPVVAAFLNTGGTSVSVWNLNAGSKLGSDISTTLDCTCLTETMVSGTATLVGNFVDSSTGATEQWFFPQGGAWTQVTDADFPTNINGFPAHMDGFVFNMTVDGKIYNSDLNSVSAYTSTNFIEANDYPDKGVTVARHGNYIVGFGEKSIQFFYNAGNATGSILSRVQGATIHMGAARRNAGTGSFERGQTVLVAFGTIWWVGAHSNGESAGIYRFNGMKPEKVSNAAIDLQLESNRCSFFVGTLSMHGLNSIVVQSSPTSGDRWAYCIENGFWWKVTLASGVITACIAESASFPGIAANTKFIGTNNARANIFQGGVYQDDSSDYTMTVQTANDDLGTRRRKFYESLALIGDDRTATSNIAVSYTDDDYASFSTARNIDMNTYPSQKLTRLGSSRRRAWKLTNAANTPLRLEALEIDFSVGQT